MRPPPLPRPRRRGPGHPGPLVSHVSHSSNCGKTCVASNGPSPPFLSVSSGTSSTFTLLCSHHHRPSADFLISPNCSSVPTDRRRPSPLPQPLAPALCGPDPSRIPVRPSLSRCCRSRRIQPFNLSDSHTSIPAQWPQRPVPSLPSPAWSASTFFRGGHPVSLPRGRVGALTVRSLCFPRCSCSLQLFISYMMYLCVLPSPLPAPLT